MDFYHRRLPGNSRTFTSNFTSGDFERARAPARQHVRAARRPLSAHDLHTRGYTRTHEHACGFKRRTRAAASGFLPRTVAYAALLKLVHLLIFGPRGLKIGPSWDSGASVYLVHQHWHQDVIAGLNLNLSGHKLVSHLNHSDKFKLGSNLSKLTHLGHFGYKSLAPPFTVSHYSVSFTHIHLIGWYI
jgi:hypothetical protein